MKKGLDRIGELIRGRNHFLVIGGNVEDLVMIGKAEYYRLLDFIEKMTERKYPNMVVWDAFNGLTIVRGSDELAIRLGLKKKPKKEKKKAKDDDIAAMMEMIGDGDNDQEPPPLTPLQAIRTVHRLLTDNGFNQPTLFVMNHADETIDTSAGSSGIKTDAQMTGLRVGLKEMSQDARIRENGHLVTLMGRHAHELSSLLARPTEAKIVRVGKPDDAMRLAFAERTLSGDAEKAQAFARASSGLSLKEIKAIAETQGEAATVESLLEACFEEKRRIIEEEYGDLLSIMRPKLGFEVIGGLTRVVDEFKRIAASMKAGIYDDVPQGFMLMGPPGTGKTLIVEALAKDLGINVFVMKDIKSMWQGESERRMSRVLDAIRDFGPCIVFIDELDQNQGQRGGYDGDNGTSRKLFQKLLKAIEDPTMRGRVLWAGATNRPDLIDSAMMRTGRFSLLVALLPPDEDRFVEICKTAPYQFQGIESKIKDWRPWAKQAKELAYTGSDMVEVVRRAMTRARRRGADKIEKQDMDWVMADFRPQSVNSKERANMTLLAIQAITSRELLPDNWEECVRECQEILAEKS